MSGNSFWMQNQPHVESGVALQNSQNNSSQNNSGQNNNGQKNWGVQQAVATQPADEANMIAQMLFSNESNGSQVKQVQAEEDYTAADGRRARQ